MKTISPKKLNKGDKVAVISLSRGIVGEDFCHHYIALGSKRLREFGFELVFTKHCLSGMKYLANHPEDRAADLKAAFADDSIKGIVCAIGGDDTYKTLPYLMEDTEFVNLVKTHPKLFIGFSDTTTNHLMFYRLGMTSFYGPNFINDLCEMDTEMLPYTKASFAALFEGQEHIIKSSDIWYEERTDFSANQIGVPRISHKEEHGYELICGEGSFFGELWGGCLETIYSLLTGCYYGDEQEAAGKYHLILEGDEWDGKVLFLETCEECPAPDVLEQELLEFAKTGAFERVEGILVGKPQNEKFYEEYKAVWKRVLSNQPDVPVLYNVNFGHAYPRCVLPYGAAVSVDVNKGEIRVL